MPVMGDSDATALSPRPGFGRRLKEKRIAKGLSQADLAKELSVTSAAVSGWEREQDTPKLQRFKDIANILGVSVTELLLDYAAPDESNGPLVGGPPAGRREGSVDSEYLLKEILELTKRMNELERTVAHLEGERPRHPRKGRRT